MIIIKAITDGETLKPERELTSDENLSVTSILSNGLYFIYYQGDEPIVEVIEEPTKD